MARDGKYDILFEPVQVGPKTMRNRFYKTPHCTSFGSDWPGTQAYFRAIAGEGGWAVVNTEYCSVHESSDDHGHVGARLWDDTDIRNLGLMCEKLHEQGALAGVELWYGSAHATNYESRMAARGVSQIPSDYAWMQTCYEMDKRDIRELQGFYVAAARRAQAAGFDLINVYGGHGHPITYRSSILTTTSGPTSTAARSRIARGSGARRSSSCAKPSETTARSWRESASNPSARAG
jgi:dimethylamine/trimethylamine dehydrogenase